MAIQVLDENTINQIAAGEVIERPASVVKELMENSIDAGATAITCEVAEGGISLIRITDNGSGIAKDELPIAFLRHSTSKIKTAEDLPFVSSLGFRGEALASIASVARVEVLTRTRDSLTGCRYRIEGGKEYDIEEVGAPEGTTVIVRDLFYNTPARRKFLKTPQTEAAHIADLAEKIALSHPEVSIRYIQNGQNKLFTSGNNNLKDIIYTIYGREITSSLIPVKGEYDAVTVGGFIGKPVIARSSRSFENYFINGRYVKSAIIGKAIEEAYKPYMMQHKFPFTMLVLRVEPELMDVNVHPAKMEIRFRDNDAVFAIIRDTISAALKENELIPSVHLDEKEEKQEERVIKKLTGQAAAQVPEPFETHRTENRYQAEIFKPETGCEEDGHMSETAYRPDGQPAYKRAGEKASFAHPAGKGEKYAPSRALWREDKAPYGTDPEKRRSEAVQIDLFDDKLLEGSSRSSHRLIGQLFDTYWLIEFENALYIIDQHAAHEKILYERTLAAFKDRELTSQQIDPPIVLTLTSRQAAVLSDHLPAFAELGFVIEPFGGREVAVRAVPDNLYALASKDLLTEMMDELSEDTFNGSPEMIREKIASMSCKAAVKGRHEMSTAEANELIDELMTLENPYTCPHGRPIIVSISRRELEKKFKRIV